MKTEEELKTESETETKAKVEAETEKAKGTAAKKRKKKNVRKSKQEQRQKEKGVLLLARHICEAAPEPALNINRSISTWSICIVLLTTICAGNPSQCSTVPPAPPVPLTMGVNQIGPYSPCVLIQFARLRDYTVATDSDR